ncbi:conserved hypothetical protein (plasmid) [Borreliella garinii Far04]|uniref:hypothetical protein n=2 Tax=Borreliella garinii TaxID=29519 RepID=UPI00018A8675|nr:hypothetical protein [Borreliella garinii]ACL35009.1 conserved hypothetical protein [Borreliella garinii Far04]WNZ68087.1 hypothetical protein PT135_04445 [Borreliella garinii]WNZ69084.1 hypothetical protein PT138_04445 [Borreliella garinii]
MKIYLYLFNIFFVMSCKLWYLNDTMEKGNQADSEVVGVVKGMLESKLEIKVLSKDNIKDMAEKVKISAKESKDKVLDKRKNDKIALEDAPSLVKEIRKSAEKVDEAVKSLIASGYSASEALKDNMKTGIDKIRLLDKILEVVPKINGNDIDFDSSDSIYDKIKKVVDEFNSKNKDEYGYSVMCMDSYPKTRGKDLVKKCIKELMKDVDKFLGDVKHSGNGVSGELLQESAKSESKQFSEPLKLLSEAVETITVACNRLGYDIDEK